MTTQVLEARSSGTSFQVHDVEQSTLRLSMRPAIELFGKSLKTEQPLIACSAENEPMVDAEAGPVHPFLKAIHIAYAHHLPLAIDPDGLWLTLAHGAAAHQNVLDKDRTQPLENITYPTNAPDEKTVDWEDAIHHLCDEIMSREASAKWYVPDFSTTGAVERSVGCILAMQAFKLRYKYSIMCICGIPRITLLGTLHDWESLRDRVGFLLEDKIPWWSEKLFPILDQFVDAAAGNPDVAFWKTIYQRHESYGSELFSGWSSMLFPYLSRWTRNGNMVERPSPDVKNPMLVGYADEERPTIPQRSSDGRFVTNEEGIVEKKVDAIGAGGIPQGLSAVPVTVGRQSALEPIECEVIGGLIGLKQHSDLTLQAKAGWGVRVACAQ